MALKTIKHGLKMFKNGLKKVVWKGFQTTLMTALPKGIAMSIFQGCGEGSLKALFKGRLNGIPICFASSCVKAFYRNW